MKQSSVLLYCKAILGDYVSERQKLKGVYHLWAAKNWWNRKTTVTLNKSYLLKKKKRLGKILALMWNNGREGWSAELGIESRAYSVFKAVSQWATLASTSRPIFGQIFEFFLENSIVVSQYIVCKEGTLKTLNICYQKHMLFARSVWENENIRAMI